MIRTHLGSLVEPVPHLEKVLRKHVLLERLAIDPDAFSDGDEVGRGVEADTRRRRYRTENGRGEGRRRAFSLRSCDVQHVHSIEIGGLRARERPSGCVGEDGREGHLLINARTHLVADPAQVLDALYLLDGPVLASAQPDGLDNGGIRLEAVEAVYRVGVGSRGRVVRE